MCEIGDAPHRAHGRRTAVVVDVVVLGSLHIQRWGKLQRHPAYASVLGLKVLSRHAVFSRHQHKLSCGHKIRYIKKTPQMRGDQRPC